MSVEEFYQWCVKHNIDKYSIECYGITPFYDVSYCSALKESNIHINERDKSILLYEDDQ